MFSIKQKAANIFNALPLGIKFGLVMGADMMAKSTLAMLAAAAIGTGIDYAPFFKNYDQAEKDLTLQMSFRNLVEDNSQSSGETFFRRKRECLGSIGPESSGAGREFNVRSTLGPPSQPQHYLVCVSKDEQSVILRNWSPL